MKKGIVTSFTILCLLSIVFLTELAVDIQTVEAGGTIYVRADGRVDPPTAPIQRDGDVYTFADNINDSIVVERDNIVLDGAGYTVKGKGGGEGITLTGRSNVTIRNMEVKAFTFGILLSSSSNNNIVGNNMTANHHGIRFEHSSNNMVSGNNMTANVIGFGLLYSSNNNKIAENRFTNDGLSVQGSYGNVVEGNLVNGKPLVYHEGVSNLTVRDAGQVILVNCTDIQVEDLNLSNVYVGVQLFNATKSKISNNTVTNSDFGMALKQSYGNTLSVNSLANNEDGIWVSYSFSNILSNNKVRDNSGYGFYIDHGSYDNSVYGNNVRNNGDGVYLAPYSYNNTFSGNNITNNNHSGIYLHRSPGNVIFHNNFVANTIQVYIPYGGYANTWDNGYPSGGNYWSDYNDVDSNHDGIGDTPYVINENGTDNYPLMGMFSGFSTSLGKYVNVVSNSTIEDFQYFQDNRTIKMYASNTTTNQTSGFCRVTIPHTLMNVTNIEVIINNGTTPLLYHNYTLYDNDTHRWIYFSYPHSKHEIDIIPEYPSLLILLLFMIATLPTVIAYRRKPEEKRKKQEYLQRCTF